MSDLLLKSNRFNKQSGGFFFGTSNNDEKQQENNEKQQENNDEKQQENNDEKQENNENNFFNFFMNGAKKIVKEVEDKANNDETIKNITQKTNDTLNDINESIKNGNNIAMKIYPYQRKYIDNVQNDIKNAVKKDKEENVYKELSIIGAVLKFITDLWNSIISELNKGADKIKEGINKISNTMKVKKRR